MGYTFKLLFLLVTIQLVTGSLVSRRIRRPWKNCKEGEFYSKDDHTCYDCTKCDNFYYESEECTATSDTVCEWCGNDLNFAEETEEVVDSYKDNCMIGRLEYMHKSELVKQLEAAEKYGSDSEERDPEAQSKEIDENAIDAESEAEKLEDEKRDKIVKELERKFLEEEGRKRKKTCDEAQYYNVEAEMCFNCTACGHFLYETAKCTKTSNTVCVWCGKEPDFKSISDVVLASYQNKCLMVKLDFVDMNELFEDDEAFESSEEEELSGKDAIIDATVRLAFEKKEEQDLIKSVRLRPEQVSSEEEDDEEEDGELDSSVSENVNAYLMSKKSEESESQTKVLDWHAWLKIEEGEKRKGKAKMITSEEVQELMDAFEPRIHNIRAPRPPKSLELLTETSEIQEDDSTEDIDGRLIKWDKWVDDKVKRIKNTEIVEAEEIRDDVLVIVNSGEADSENSMRRINFSAILANLTVLSMFIIFILVCFFFTCIKRRTKKSVFLGVPTDSPDYHMIIEASNYIEELEKKEKKASRHIHENPIFDI